MSRIDTSILEIRTDHAAAVKGFADLESRGVQLGKSMQRAGADMSNSMTSLGSAAKSAGALLAGAFAVTTIVAAGKHVIDYASHVSDLSERLRVSTDAIQEWEGIFG